MNHAADFDNPTDVPARMGHACPNAPEPGRLGGDASQAKPSPAASEVLAAAAWIEFRLGLVLLIGGMIVLLIRETT